MAKVNLYDKTGAVKDNVSLPDVFNTPYRPDIIKKSFNVLRSHKRQRYGASKMAGKRHATESWGPGRGVSRIPRLSQGRRAALAPGTVGGRRAHPPKSEKKWDEKINKNEKKLSIASALAATANKDLVRERGHKITDDITLPVIVEDKIKDIKKTKDFLELCEKIGVYADIERSTTKRHVRAGKGKSRGRKYKTPKSLLIISEPGKIHNSARNITGVDIVTPNQLNIEHLAPGGNAGRLTLITSTALKQLSTGGK